MSRFVLLCLCLTACTLPPLADAGASPHAERIAAAQGTYEAVQQAHSMGMTGLDDVCAWSVRWHRAKKEAGDASAGAEHLARMEALAAQVNQAVAAGTAPPHDAKAMAYFVAEAKVWAEK